MKYMIASDIHGSAYYCEKMLARFKEEKADRLLLLGDLLYHGPRNDLPKEYAPKQVIEMLNAHSNVILCVRGNCEAEVDQMVLDFPVMAEYCLLSEGSQLVMATHGHVFNLDNPPKLQKGDILLYGHTHVPANVETETFRYLNPGSVAIPKENSPHSYMIWEKGSFIWKDLLDGTEYQRYTAKSIATLKPLIKIQSKKDSL